MATTEEHIALYDYTGQSAKDLSFKKHDVLIIKARGKDPNWWVAEDKSGKCGFVPSNFVKPLHKDMKERHNAMSNPFPWFHGKIGRADAEALMKENDMRSGLFLLRESTNFPGDYTLSVCFDNEVQHYRVETVSNGKLTIDQESFFDDMTQLVEHYRALDDGLVTKLLIPIVVKGVQPVIDRRIFKKAGWEIDRSEVTLGKILGSGNFGDVYEGQWRDRKVAIKTLKGDDSLAASFLSEASVMTRLMHPNLVQLLGVCTDDAPIFILTEFMKNGNMLDYLRSRGRTVVTLEHMHKFCTQILSGMEYLEEKNFVHRDLAARNVLVGENNVCKVADFGLATSAAEVTGIDSSQIPIKWTAPEAIKDNKYTSKSDVWSFGVVVWEIYSFGRTPYPRMQHDEVVTKVREGYRMESPSECPPKMYAIMCLCWTSDVAARPSFKQLTSKLAAAL